MRPNAPGTIIVLVLSDGKAYVEKLHADHATRTQKKV